MNSDLKNIITKGLGVLFLMAAIILQNKYSDSYLTWPIIGLCAALAVGLINMDTEDKEKNE